MKAAEFAEKHFNEKTCKYCRKTITSSNTERLLSHLYSSCKEVEEEICQESKAHHQRAYGKKKENVVIVDQVSSTLLFASSSD